MGSEQGRVKDIRAREIIDSRGNPTVEADIILSDGTQGRGSVPSGASTGSREAREVRDGDPDRYRGRGVLRAVAALTGEIRDALIGKDVLDQRLIDSTLRRLDGTADKGRLGANALLAASLAAANAAACASGVPLYRHIGGVRAPLLPVPFMNILNGGQHADNNVNVQEFMILPAGAGSFSEALRWGCEIYHALGDGLRDAGLGRGVGDEGGFAPDLDDDEQALELIMEAVERAGYAPGEQVYLALDAAASEFHTGGQYHLGGETLSAPGLVELYRCWCEQYPIISIEDGLAEDDWDGWCRLTEELGEGVQLVGDDLFVTDRDLVERGYELGAGNAVLVKPNQIGTVTETLETLNYAEAIGFSACVSHRSGETADTFIADLAVACGCGQIKTGAPCRIDRVEKYNRLLRIEEELGDEAQFAGRSPFMLE